MKKAKLDGLTTALKTAQSSAIGSINTSINHARAELMRRYDGELYGDEIKDRSRAVDTTVRDTIESIKPELSEIFYAGDKVVEFSPRGQEDVNAAEQETAVVNHVITQMNDGHSLFMGWFHDALLTKNGYVKRYWDERLTEEVEEYADLTQDELVATVMAADQQGEVEFLEYEVNEETGRADIKFSVAPRDPWIYRIENVPPEEIIIHPEWTRLDFDGCPFVAHKRTMTVTDLIEMGFDKEEARSLPTHDRRLDNEEAEQRFSGQRTTESGFGIHADDSMRDVLVYENYVRFDIDGDGAAELLQVYTAGEDGKILTRDGKPAVENVDGAPFNVLTPIPQPHRHFGLSIAEMVDDIAREKTVLKRQMLDNAVISNNPDVVVDEDAMSPETVEDLAVTQPGRVIRIRGGIQSVQYMQPPALIQQTLAAQEALDAEKESRTGVTRFNQGLEADSLNKTMGGMKALMNQAQKKILLIARTFAETGVRRLFLDVHRDLRKGPLKQISIQLRNEWVAVSPRTWATRSDMAINVGLGTGDRDIQYERLMAILAKQEQALGAGLVEPQHIHHTLTKMVELSGFKDVNAFFPEPPDGPMPQPEPQPDPAMILAQVEQMKAQVSAESDAMKMQADAQIAREKMALDAQLRREEMASKERIEMAKLDFNAHKALLDDAGRSEALAGKNADATTRQISGALS